MGVPLKQIGLNDLFNFCHSIQSEVGKTWWVRCLKVLTAVKVWMLISWAEDGGIALVSTYHSSQHYNPEDQHRQYHR